MGLASWTIRVCIVPHWANGFPTKLIYLFSPVFVSVVSYSCMFCVASVITLKVNFPGVMLDLMCSVYINTVHFLLRYLYEAALMMNVEFSLKVH